MLEALEPDRIAMAIAALTQVEEEVRQFERQWSRKRNAPLRSRTCRGI